MPAATQASAERLRTCVGCREKRRQSELVRLAAVVAGDGTVGIGVAVSGGRGAWVCPQSSCIALVVKRRPLSKALRAQFESDAYASLTELAELAERAGAAAPIQPESG